MNPYRWSTSATSTTSARAGLAAHPSSEVTSVPMPNPARKPLMAGPQRPHAAAPDPHQRSARRLLRQPLESALQYLLLDALAQRNRANLEKRRKSRPQSRHF